MVKYKGFKEAFDTFFRNLNEVEKIKVWNLYCEYGIREKCFNAMTFAIYKNTDDFLNECFSNLTPSEIIKYMDDLADWGRFDNYAWFNGRYCLITGNIEDVKKVIDSFDIYYYASDNEDFIEMLEEFKGGKKLQEFILYDEDGDYL